MMLMIMMIIIDDDDADQKQVSNLLPMFAPVADATRQRGPVLVSTFFLHFSVVIQLWILGSQFNVTCERPCYTALHFPE